MPGTSGDQDKYGRASCVLGCMFSCRDDDAAARQSLEWEVAIAEALNNFMVVSTPRVADFYNDIDSHNACGQGRCVDQH